MEEDISSYEMLENICKPLLNRIYDDCGYSDQFNCDANTIKNLKKYVFIEKEGSKKDIISKNINNTTKTVKNTNENATEKSDDKKAKAKEKEEKKAKEKEEKKAKKAKEKEDKKTKEKEDKKTKEKEDKKVKEKSNDEKPKENEKEETVEKVQEKVKEKDDKKESKKLKKKSKNKIDDDDSKNDKGRMLLEITDHQTSLRKSLQNALPNIANEENVKLKHNISQPSNNGQDFSVYIPKLLAELKELEKKRGTHSVKKNSKRKRSTLLMIRWCIEEKNKYYYTAQRLYDENKCLKLALSRYNGANTMCESGNYPLACQCNCMCLPCSNKYCTC